MPMDFALGCIWAKHESIFSQSVDNISQPSIPDTLNVAATVLISAVVSSLHSHFLLSGVYQTLRDQKESEVDDFISYGEVVL
jgi:hypothetical protein